MLIDKSITLSGGWNASFTTLNGISTIDGQDSRVGILNLATASINHFAVQNGFYCSTCDNRGGGITSFGTLTLNDMTISDNVSSRGGGIYISGSSAELNNVLITNNTSSREGGGIYITGFSASPPTVNINNTTLSNNTANYDGGGVYVYQSNLTIQSSTISQNVTQTQFTGGGGIYAVDSTLTVNNSTISENITYNGGGIYLTGSTGALANINNTTIAYNSASQAGGIVNGSNGLFVIRNSLVAPNTSLIQGPECMGSITSAGYNLIGDNSNCNFSATTGDIIGTSSNPVNPALDSLQDNGGPTFTHSLIPSSPAINTGNPAGCKDHNNNLFTTDQRGETRPIGPACDIGSVESEHGDVSGTYTYNANNETLLPGILLCTPNETTCTNGVDPHADSAHKYAAGIIDLYNTQHNRNNMFVASTVHYKTGYKNAFWNGYMMVFGDGYGFALADDVVAHELTHGVTQYESNLFYWYQSGAINESFSDLWGEYYDQTNGLGNDDASVKWLAGEDITGLGAIRSMSNPPAFGDPDKMTSAKYYKGSSDNGGIHTNSGVNNKAVFLMVDGDAFNGKTVAGIGWEKTAAIYYEANTNLLGSASNYSDLYYALQQACKSLTGFKGITPEDCINVKQALDAVQMNTPISTKTQVTAPLCPTGMAPSTTLFSDNMEGTLSTNWNATSRWSLNTDLANSPAHALYGDDHANNLLEEANMKTGVVLPPNSYLHFNHGYDFDYFLYMGTNYYFDGGVVEYSNDNGSTWKDAGTLFSGGANYGGTIFPNSGNQLGNRKAFVGSSYTKYIASLVSTRYDLGSLAGQTVRFRFRFATDESVQFNGWHIDDVKIYTCLGVPTVPVLQIPANNALIKVPAPTLEWTDSTPNIDRYHLQVSTDSTFATTLYDEANLPTSQFVLPAPLASNTKYYWRVRSFNSEDATNNWSAVRNFRTIVDAPVLTAPDDATDALTLRPSFDWSDASGPGAITGYTIQVSKNNTFTQVVNTGNPIGSSYTPTADLPKNITLFWRVLAKGANGPSAWSAVRSFNSANSPTAPVLSLPANNSLNTNYIPLLKWKPVTLPAGTTFKHYQLQIDDTSDFSSPVLDDTSITDRLVIQFQVVAPLAHNTKFYWRVRAMNTADEVSNWSSVWNVRAVVDAPLLLAPANGTPAGTLKPTFDWNDASGPGAITNYTIQISTSPTFGAILFTKNVTASTYTAVANLPADKTLYWRVRVNGANGPSAWSKFQFTTPP